MMFRVTFLALACLAFNAQANDCCGSYTERSDCCSSPAQYVVEESAPMQEIEEVEEYAAPEPARAPVFAPTPAPLAPKITIEITQTPQPVTEPAPAPTPAHYEAPADPCGHPSGCGEEVTYVEQKKLVPVRRERVQLRHLRPVHHHTARYVAVQEAAPCSSTCHASVGCCQ